MSSATEVSLRDYLDVLLNKHEGIITPEIILKDARSRKSPLHQYFTWDNGDAANEYRLIQARRLIRRVKITYDMGGDKKIKVRKFVSISEDQGTGAYVDLDDALKNPHWKQIMLSDALVGLRSYREKFAALTEITETDYLDKLEEALERSKSN